MNCSKKKSALYDAHYADGERVDSGILDTELTGLGNASAVEQERLQVEAKDEMDKLVEMGFARDKIPEDIQPFQLEALKAQRLLNENNHSEALALLNSAFDDLSNTGMMDASTVASTKNLMNQFFDSSFLDDSFKQEIGEKILTMIFQQQNDYHGAIQLALKPTGAPREKIQQIESILTPELRRANHGLYQKLLNERTQLFQILNPENFE